MHEVVDDVLVIAARYWKVGACMELDGSAWTVRPRAVFAFRTARASSRAWSDKGSIVLHVLVDEIRLASREAVDALHARGITGDAEPVTRSVARALHIDQVLAGVRPENKSDRVKSSRAGPARGGGR